MNVLFVSATAPQQAYTGASIRSNKVWRAVAQVATVDTIVLAGDAPSGAALQPTEQARELARIRFRNTRLPSPSVDRAVRGLIAQAVAGRRYDAVVARHLRVAMLLRGSVPARIVLDADDLSKTVSPDAPWLQRTREQARELARNAVTRMQIGHFAHVWYVNPADARKFPVGSGSILPNVVDLPAERAADVVPAEVPTVLMVGTFSYQPNVDGARYFMREAWPAIRAARPDAVLRLVGGCPEPLRREWSAVPGVQVCGYVDDLAVEYARAGAVIAPIHSGGGTQIKVLEAMAHGCGLVVSPFSLSGFQPHLRAGEHALLAATPADWPRECLRLLADPALARRLGAAGRAMVATHYSYDCMAAEVARTLSALGARDV